jgi:hypothetical protein
MDRRLNASTVLVSALLLAVAVLRVKAEEPPPHFIFPVNTPLQREIAPVGTNLLVILDVTAALKGNQIDPDALKLQDLRAVLTPLAKSGPKLHVTLFFGKSTADQAVARSVIRYALIGAGHEAGFATVKVGAAFQNADMTWAEYAASFTGKRRQPVGDEPAVVNDLVKAYPVRTELSRCLTSDADCVVVIVPSLVNETGNIPKKVSEATADVIRKLKLPHTQRVSFYLEDVTDEDAPQLAEQLSELAKKMGFEASSVTFR